MDIKIGDVEVYIDYGTGETFLGQTLGGVEFTLERNFEDLTVDKFGVAPVDKVFTGNNLMIKAYLAEPTKSNISKAATEGLYASQGTDSKLGIGAQAGLLMSTDAGILRLHPRGTTPSDRNNDIYIWKAVSIEAINLPFKVDEQRILEVTWQALVDENRPNGEHLGRIGDADIS